MQNRQQAPFWHRWWNYFIPVCPYTAVRINFGLLAILEVLKKLCSSYLNINLSLLLQWYWALLSRVAEGHVGSQVNTSKDCPRPENLTHILSSFPVGKTPSHQFALVRAPSPSEEPWRQQLTMEALSLTPTSVSAGCLTLARKVPKLWNTSFFLCLLVFSHWLNWI